MSSLVQGGLSPKLIDSKDASRKSLRGSAGDLGHDDVDEMAEESSLGSAEDPSDDGGEGEVSGPAVAGLEKTLTLKVNKIEKIPEKRTNRLIMFCFAIAVPCVVSLLVAAGIFISRPYKYYPVAYNLPSPPRLEGVLSPNNILARGRKFLEGEIKGPEYLILRNGLLYTGTSDGKIVSISKDGRMKVVAKLGKEPCGGPENEVNCGRPLGMEFDVDGYLVVCDSYLGIFRVDVNTGEFQTLLPASTKVGGKNLTFTNDLEISRDGDIYFTDSSVDFGKKDYLMDVIRGLPAGRLLKLDPLKGETSVILNNLAFPNGILLSSYEDFILFSETTRARIMKHHIKGIKAGKTEVFIDNLPCLPDNLHNNLYTGTIWVACSHLRHDGKLMNMLDLLQKWTTVRRFLMELPLTMVFYYFKPGSMLLEIDWQGNLLQAMMDEEDVATGYLSHVTRDEEGRFYIGSYASEFITILEPRDAESK